jgi:phage/plasmid-like protein (TIGR03299 family)
MELEMSHNLEMILGKAAMAYAGETPWHGLGTKVSNDLSAKEMLVAADLDWEVEKMPLFYGDPNSDKVYRSMDQSLVRKTDMKEFCTTSKDWNPVQNQQVADFFHDFVEENKVKMDTAGALNGGSHIWMLARMEGEFSILKGKDTFRKFLLFSNPHIYGKRVDIRVIATRVVCENTIMMGLREKADYEVRLNHSKPFDVEAAQEAMGLATKRADEYKEVAEFLASKRADEEDIKLYFDAIFPVSTKSEKTVSRAAETAMLALTNQPGAELGEGTWWQPFNAVTFALDHVLGRTSETRLNSNWYGPNRTKKLKAMGLAMEMASKGSSN